MKKRIFTIALVTVFVVGIVSTVNAVTCSYCGWGGQLVCQRDQVSDIYQYCSWCDQNSSYYATHHLICTNGDCGAAYYYGTHRCVCRTIYCGWTCPY